MTFIIKCVKPAFYNVIITTIKSNYCITITGCHWWLQQTECVKRKCNLGENLFQTEPSLTSDQILSPVLDAGLPAAISHLRFTVHTVHLM